MGLGLGKCSERLVILGLVVVSKVSISQEQEVISATYAGHDRDDGSGEEDLFSKLVVAIPLVGILSIILIALWYVIHTWKVVVKGPRDLEEPEEDAAGCYGVEHSDNNTRTEACTMTMTTDDNHKAEPWSLQPYEYQLEEEEYDDEDEEYIYYYQRMSQDSPPTYAEAVLGTANKSGNS